MPALLTLDEYRAMAQAMALPQHAFINGGFRPARSGKTFATTDPFTGRTVCEIAACDHTDVDEAVTHARAAFEDGRWSRQTKTVD